MKFLFLSSGFARLFTFAYSSSFVLALTELVVSALSGRLYSQSQIQQSLTRDQNITTTAGGVSSTTKSSHAEVIFSKEKKIFSKRIFFFVVNARTKFITFKRYSISLSRCYSLYNRCWLEIYFIKNFPKDFFFLF